MKITGAELVARFLEMKEVPGVFQLSGGMIAFLTDTISSRGTIRLISNRHEQASGFAAEGASRVSGKPAVALATSGPGATNLVTPIASCYFDSTPAIFITGQVRMSEIRKDLRQRQNGFQELDIIKLTTEITKANFFISNIKDLANVLEESWEIAISNRPGPVLIDIPIDLQQEFIDVKSNKVTRIAKEKNLGQIDHSRKIELLLRESKKPIVLIGGGVRLSNTVLEARQFLEKTNLPFVTTLMGLDAVDMYSPNYLGYIGSYGNRWSNEALAESDLVIALGTRLDNRQVGSKEQFTNGPRKVVRVELDEFERKNDSDSVLNLCSDLKDFFSYPLNYRFDPDENELIDITMDRKNLCPQASEQSSSLLLNPNDVMEKISDIFSESQGYIVDVGQHQMWAAQSIKISSSQRFLTSGGLGAMGFAIPASIGAAVAKTGQWVCIVGDGCAQLSIAELQTISQENLNIVVCIINNNQHGMVAQFQEQYMDSRFIGTRAGYSNPDYKEISKAFGILNYTRVSTSEELASLENQIHAFKPGPILIEFVIEPEAKALPKWNFNIDMNSHQD